jgi:competence protein ComEA
MTVTPRLRGVLSRTAARVIGSRFAKPAARAALVASGLVLLAVIGRTEVASGLGTSVMAAVAGATASTSTSTSTPTATATPTTTATPTATSTPPPSHRAQASPDDPVVLNTATSDDLRRLPGIGEKRASAILELRAHLGRLRAIEDLLKVKGIGRATLRRLRPSIRLETPAPVDAGPSPPATSR